MRPLVLIHGTWSRYKDWHLKGSPLRAALEARGFLVYDFLWSGYCGGVPSPVIVPQDAPEIKGELMLWQSEGEKLLYLCRALQYEAPDVISHSHGLQVVSFAAASGQTFGTVLSLSGPVRKDVEPWRKLARPNIQKWIQVVDPEDDMTIREGLAFDGHFGWVYHLPEADQNIEVPGYGHSGLILDIAAWDRLGLWKAMEVS